MYIRKFIKKQLTLAIITFSMLGVVILGSSYALFQKTVVDEKTQSLSVGDLNISFLQKNTGGNFADELIDSNAITLTNIMPKTDAAAIADNNQIYTFAIHNGGTTAYSYKISLDDTTAKCTTEGCYDLYPFLRYKLNDDNPWMLKNLVELNACDEDSTNWSCQIYNYVINPGETHTFTLKIWLADADKYKIPNELLGRSGQININIEGEATNIRAPKGWTYAKEGTLLYGIKQNQDRAYNANYNPKNITLTTPGTQISTIDEGLRDAQDDYGTSYYFRGAVTNNYVVFARKCWRIVRITGDGSIKLVLHNNDAENCEISDNTLNFAKYDGEHYESKFNSDANIYGTATGVGFMYGDYEATNYLDAQANVHDSTILTKLKAWYDYVDGNSTPTFTTNEKEMLADVIWCGDKSLDLENGSGLGWGTDTTYFGTRKRISITKQPSLICPNIESDISLSKYTASDLVYGNGALNGYKLGLLTVDEGVFAGGIFGKRNDSYFLNTDKYWTMSPSGSGNGSSTNWMSNVSVSTSYSRESVTISSGLRPSIALKSNVKYTITGPTNTAGTAANPFIIEES